MNRPCLIHLYAILLLSVTLYQTAIAREDRVDDDSVTVVNLLDDARAIFSDQPQAALILVEEAVDLASKIKSKDLGLKAERFLSYYYAQIGEYDAAAASCFRVLQNFGSGSSVAASIFDQLGEIMRLNGNPEDAFDYHEKSLRIYFNLDSKLGIAYTYNSIGLVHELIGAFDSALYYHHMSLKIKTELGDSSGMADSYSNMGTIYRRTGDLEKAIEVQLRTLELDLAHGNQIYIAITHNNLGVIYLDIGNLTKALNHLEEALQLARRANARDVIKYSNQQLALLYEQKGEFQKAYEYYKVYTATKDSLFNEDKSKEIGKLEARYEFEKAEEDKNRVEAMEHAAILEAEKRRNNLQYSGILIFLVVMIAFVMTLGRFSISDRLVEGLIFFTFLLFFEFCLVLLDPQIEKYSGGEPAYKLLFNAVLAGLIFPLHGFFESKLKSRIAK